MNFRIEVTAKPASPDAAGAAILAQLPLVGVSGVKEVRVGSLYEIAGRLTAPQATAAAQHLLADPITQDFRVDGQRPPAPHRTHGAWRVEVWLKPAVTDPVGTSACRAIADLGLPAPESVRCGTAYTFFGRLNQVQAEKIAAKLLANPIIHRFFVTPG